MAAQVSTTAEITLRPVQSDDVHECGRICFEGFDSISRRHNFPRDFPDVETATGLIGMLIEHPGFYGVVAERNGNIVGSNFLDERSTIAGIGPITVDPRVQDRGIGRLLMRGVLDRASAQSFPGVRLVQAGYHTRSFSLYASLGFEVREPLACMQGNALNITIPGRAVREALEADMAACNEICRRVHGHDRAGELVDAIRVGAASVVEHDGRISGYTTGVAFFGHTVGETDDDLKALIGAAQAFPGAGFLLPARSPVLRWCLEHRLRVAQLLTLMTVGLYNEPKGACLSSILY